MSNIARLQLVSVSIWGAALAVSAQTPRIVSVGPEEFCGPGGRLSTIAVDTLNQPHVVADGGSFAYFYDKIGGAWQNSSFDLGTTGHSQFYNPDAAIDRNNTLFVSGIVMQPTMGLGVFARRNVATQPVTTLDFERVGGKGFDTGSLDIDPWEPDRVVLSTSDGIWKKYQLNGAGTLDLLQSGQLYAGQGGEKSAFFISKSKVGTSTPIWHGATGGWDAYPSAYNNSLRGRATPIPWASFASYPNMADDGTYVSCVADLVDPRIAYMASDFSNGKRSAPMGICMNIYNGSAMVFPPTAILVVDPAGSSGLRRFAPQMAPAKSGGVFITWTRGSTVLVRYVSPQGAMGPEVVVGSGARSSICVDADGNVHIAYNRSGMRYRMINVFDPTVSRYSGFAMDFDGDGRDDPAVFRSESASWYILRSRDGFASINWGGQRDLPVPADYDGDGRADVAVFRKSDSTWYINGSTIGFMSAQFGSDGDYPVPGDWDGDGKADPAVYRPGDKTWHIRQSSDNTVRSVPWGADGDIPAPADYDGDGVMDLCVYRPSAGLWTGWRSRDGAMSTTFGSAEDMPVPADYDGDGRADVAVVRPSSLTWFIFRSTAGFMSEQWGGVGDIPVPGRFDGDRVADLAVFRGGVGSWFIKRSTDGKMKGRAPVYWGYRGDVPVPGDWDGDGRAEVAVFNAAAGAWAWFGSRDGFRQASWGSNGDVPVAGDYDGDGRRDVAVFRPSSGNWHILEADGAMRTVAWGGWGDVPIPADYDGDGKTDIAVFRPSAGGWFINRSGGAPLTQVWGMQGDTPVPADYDGDGRADICVFRPSSGGWHAILSNGGTLTENWGGWGDTPIPFDADNDGRAEPAVFRPSTGTWYAVGRAPLPMGGPGDRPLPADYDGDGTIDPAIFRTVPQGQWYILGSRFNELMEAGGPIVFGSDGDLPVGGRYKVAF